MFGCAYLLGDYTTSDRYLDLVKTKHGLSFWLAEREFMLLQAAAGFEGHKKKLSEIQKNLTNSLTGYIITTTSNRLEPHVTPESFQRSYKEDLKGLHEDGHGEFASWVELHIAPWSFDWIKDKHQMLHRYSGKCLIDRYDRTIKILSCIPSCDLTLNERKLLHPILLDLGSAINDRQLTHLAGTLEAEKYTVDERTSQYLDGLDKLVSGDYAACAQLSEALILEEPTCFDFYWLLAKSTACRPQSIVRNIPENCVARDILNSLSQIAQNRVAIDFPLVKLNDIALKLGDNHLGLSLRQFALYEESGVYNASAANQIAIQSKIDTCSLMRSHESATLLDQADTIVQHYSNHLSVQLELYSKGLSSDEMPSLKISRPFASIARASRLAINGDHSEVIKELNLLLGAESEIPNELNLHGLTIALLQFEALIGLDLAEDAANAITRQYLQNPNNLRHVPFQRLIEGCTSGRWDSLRRLPCWPILVTLNNGSEQDVYEAVDDLLLEHGCQAPLSIADGTIACSLDELRIILRDILLPRVISRGALWNSTAEGRREMRKQLLQKLYAIATDDQELVVEELSQLEQAQLLETAYRKIEGPKFELSYSAMNRELAKLFEGTFGRYSEHRNYEAKGGMLANESDFLASARDGVDIEIAKEKKGETSGIFLRQIMYETFINYLLDTSSGINSFLGTRIRHGSLENHLTRVLGFRNLLALKNASGTYVCDSFVIDHLKTSERNVRDKVTGLYCAFTDRINDLVDNIVSSILRIRVPESIFTLISRQGMKTGEIRSDIGFLDFSALFSEDAVSRLDRIEFSSVSLLLSEAERMFVHEANLAFVNVREFFERNVTKEIGDALNSLDSDIQEALPEGVERTFLLAQILAAKGEYAQDIKIISTWFSAAEPSDSGLGSLKNVFSMASRVVQFASNGKLGRLTMGEFHDENPPAQIGRLMYEVVSILLRNVVQHSRIESGQEVSCKHLINAERRCLILRNRVCDERKCDELINRAEDAIAMPFDEWALGTAPGGTGFARIRKLLKQAGFSTVKFAVRKLHSPCRFETEINY